MSSLNAEPEAQDKLQLGNTTVANVPPETLQLIARFFCEDWTHDFDKLAQRDLRNLRLVSRAFTSVATPLLFQNVIFDEKFLEENHLSRILQFAKEHTQLAIRVKRVQYRLAPIFYGRQIWSSSIARELLSKANGVNGGRNVGHVSEDEERRLDALLLEPLRAWARNVKSLRDPQDRSQFPFVGGHPVFFQALHVLPSLAHVEFTTSVHWSQHLQDSINIFEKEWGVRIEPPDLPDIALDTALITIPGQLWRLVQPPIASLKLVDQTFPIHRFWARNLTHLTHLDLECAVQGILAERYDFVFNWRGWAAALNMNIRSLIQLRVLRVSLKVESSFHFGLLEPRDPTTESYYFDSVLTGCRWQYLESLALVNWPMRESSLSEVIARHAGSLKNLNLEKLNLLRPRYSGPEDIWPRVAASCSQCSKLDYLAFTGIKTHWWWSKETGDEIFEVRALHENRLLKTHNLKSHRRDGLLHGGRLQ